MITLQLTTYVDNLYMYVTFVFNNINVLLIFITNVKKL